MTEPRQDDGIDGVVVRRAKQAGREVTERDEVRPLLLGAAAHYFLDARNGGGRPVDPVARFHLGNGARLERLNFLGDVSARALRESYGLMVNYLYKLDDIERNHEAYAERGEVVASPEVRKWNAAPNSRKTTAKSPEKTHA